MPPAPRLRAERPVKKLGLKPKIGHRGTEPGLDVRTAQAKPVLQRRSVWLDRLELTRCQRRRASVKGAAGSRQADAFSAISRHGQAAVVASANCGR